jgi:hypothetical protein
MQLPRSGHTATLLNSGKVLVVGGAIVTSNYGYTNTAELYDPSTNMWTLTGTLTQARANHAAVLLANGKVLVAGGNACCPLDSAELYDPAANTWSQLNPLQVARTGMGATLLANGMVLVAGGSGVGGILPSAELYDPSTGNWTVVGAPLLFPREYPQLTSIANGPAAGKAILTGGDNGQGSVRNAEIFDPTAGTWSAAGMLGWPRESHSSALLGGNVNVAVAAGANDHSPLNTAEVYDPTSNSWAATTGSLTIARKYHTATLLGSGRMLVAGGEDGACNNLSSAEVYDPTTGNWTLTSNSLGTARALHTATLLGNGAVLVAGGLTRSDTVPTRTAELYTSMAPVPGMTGWWVAALAAALALIGGLAAPWTMRRRPYRGTIEQNPSMH